MNIAEWRTWLGRLFLTLAMACGLIGGVRDRDRGAGVEVGRHRLVHRRLSPRLAGYSDAGRRTLRAQAGTAKQLADLVTAGGAALPGRASSAISRLARHPPIASGPAELIRQGTVAL